MQDIKNERLGSETLGWLVVRAWMNAAFACCVRLDNNGGEIEEVDTILVFGETSLVLKDEDSNVLRTLPYSSVRKATYSRTQRRIMFVRTTRHQLILGSGGEEVVLRLPDANYRSILSQIEKHTGVTVAQ